MNSKDKYFSSDYIKKSDIVKNNTNKDDITWLKCPGDVPKWLADIFTGKNYKERMDALRELNENSLKCRVENN